MPYARTCGGGLAQGHKGFGTLGRGEKSERYGGGDVAMASSGSNIPLSESCTPPPHHFMILSLILGQLLNPSLLRRDKSRAPFRDPVAKNDHRFTNLLSFSFQSKAQIHHLLRALSVDTVPRTPTEVRLCSPRVRWPQTMLINERRPHKRRGIGRWMYRTAPQPPPARDSGRRWGRGLIVDAGIAAGPVVPRRRERSRRSLTAHGVRGGARAGGYALQRDGARRGLPRAVVKAAGGGGKTVWRGCLR